MSTVSKTMADKLVACNGCYKDDMPVVRIVEYTNAWGGTAYGLECEHQMGRYAPSEYVIDPRVYWEAKHS